MADTFTISNIDDWHSLIEKAINGDSDAMNELVFYYDNGLVIDNTEIIKPDSQLAFEWTRKSYESGNIEGTIRYAHYLSDGEYQYAEKNIELAMKLYEKAMHQGNHYATYCLGREYRNKQNFEKAFELYLKSNRSEEFYPDLTLGLCHYYGVGTRKDKLKAFEIFKNVNQEDNTQYEIDEANYYIGKMHLEGEVIEQSMEKARYYLELADKDEDHRSAQELLIIIGRSKFIN